MPKNGSFIESIGFFKIYKLIYDNIYQCLSILQKIIIPNIKKNMNIIDKINIFCQIKQYYDEEYNYFNFYREYRHFKRLLGILFDQIKNYNYSVVDINSLKIIEKNIDNIFTNINELKSDISFLKMKFENSEIQNSKEMIKNNDLAFLLKVDFNHFENSKPVKDKLKNIIEKYISHPPFFLNYIGFFENDDSFQKYNYYHEDKIKNISLSLKYEKNTKEDLVEILEEISESLLIKKNRNNDDDNNNNNYNSILDIDNKNDNNNDDNSILDIDNKNDNDDNNNPEKRYIILMNNKQE